MQQLRRWFLYLFHRLGNLFNLPCWNLLSSWTSWSNYLFKLRHRLLSSVRHRRFCLHDMPYRRHHRIDRINRLCNVHRRLLCARPGHSVYIVRFGSLSINCQFDGVLKLRRGVFRCNCWSQHVRQLRRRQFSR